MEYVFAKCFEHWFDFFKRRIIRTHHGVEAPFFGFNRGARKRGINQDYAFLLQVGGNLLGGGGFGG